MGFVSIFPMLSVDEAKIGSLKWSTGPYVEKRGAPDLVRQLFSASMTSHFNLG